MSEQPICVYCNKGPFATLQEWDMHACHSRWDMGEIIEKLRSELKVVQDKLAEKEERSCKNCARDYLCTNIVLCDETEYWEHELKLTFCSAHKPMEPKP